MEITDGPMGKMLRPAWMEEYAGIPAEAFHEQFPSLYIRGARVLSWKGEKMLVQEDGVVVVRKGRIVYAGAKKQAPAKNPADVTVDAEGRLVTPGLIDPHTHLMFAGDRSREFAMRLEGASYEDILKAGGGINSTVSATRQAPEDDLIALARERLDEEMMRGVTTVEAKTGYFLDLEGELKALKLYSELSLLHPLRIAPTLLSAHVTPAEFKDRPDDYLRLITEEIIPQAARVREQRTGSPAENAPWHIHTLFGDPMPHWAVDVFCERSAFSVEQARQVLEAAKRHGFAVKLHAGQFSAMGAADLGARMGALSVDHMEYYTDEELDSIARAGTTVVFLPGAAYSLRMNPPHMDDFRRRGIPVALATDMNPGTSMTTHLPLMMSMGTQLCGMTVEEAWRAVTLNAARALGMADKLGNLAPGAVGDLVIWHFTDPSEIPWRMGEGYPWLVVREGIVVWEN